MECHNTNTSSYIFLTHDCAYEEHYREQRPKQSPVVQRMNQYHNNYGAVGVSSDGSWRGRVMGTLCRSMTNRSTCYTFEKSMFDISKSV
jgi:hypothetical protein